MSMPVKLIVSCKKQLKSKYGKGFSSLEKKLAQLVKSDKLKKLDTKVVYIDDATSMRKVGIKAVSAPTPKNCKDAIDSMYKKWIPAYIVILGAQDVFPFQEINNPAEDEDQVVPSDLPYACDAAYSRDISAFTGPTRVVGRIPDIPGKGDVTYLEKILDNCISHKSVDGQLYNKYFAITTDAWKKSTQLSLFNIFSESKSLQVSPPKKGVYTDAMLKPLTHFYNCHGAPNDINFYGQKGDNYPVSISAPALQNHVSPGTVVAAECCYGAELVDPSMLDDQNGIGIANTYFKNGALAFMGSSTIAYGPADSQGLADLITQFFVKNVMHGASIGRALLEARQLFLTKSAPHLDPYELKTLAQFFLLGDPSIQPAISDDLLTKNSSAGNSIENNRINLFNKGISLKNEIAPASKKRKSVTASKNKKEINQILKNTDFTDAVKELVYDVEVSSSISTGIAKKLMGSNASFRTFIKPGKKGATIDIEVLVVKENNDQVLGWRVYVSR